MKGIALGRGEGKTTAILDWYAVKPETRAIVTFSEHEALRLRRILFGRGIVHPRVHSIHEVIRYGGLRGTGITDVAYDNIELALTSLTGQNTARISYTESPDYEGTRVW